MPVSKAILTILTATAARSTYKLYGTYEGVVPARRVAVYNSGKPATVNECLDCKVYDDRGNGDNNILLFWIGIPDRRGNSYEIIEESMDPNTMICLTTSTPDLLWLKGTNPVGGGTTAPVVDLTDFPDLASLKQTNQRAIEDAQSRSASNGDASSTSASVVGPVASAPPVGPSAVDAPDGSPAVSAPVCSPVAKENTSDHVFDDISTITKDDNPSDDVGPPIMIPEKVLKSEKMLVSTLGNLNDLRKKVYVVEIIVGGHRVKLQTFHYPEINLEAPMNKSSRTYIDAEDMPILFSYEFKSALTTQVKVIPILLAGYIQLIN